MSLTEAALLPVAALKLLVEASQPPDYVDEAGVAYWKDSHGLAHRGYDLPAIVARNGKQQWYRHGRRHRTHGMPAIIEPNSLKIWAVNGNFCSEEESLRATVSVAVAT
jgi:hypothetical protein